MEKATYFMNILLIRAQSEKYMLYLYAGAMKKLSLQSRPIGTFRLAYCIFFYVQ